MNRSQSNKIVAMLATNARNTELTDASLEAWFLVLDDVPYDAALGAVRDWIRYEKWFPFPSEFRKLIAVKLAGLPPPDEAWRMVRARMRATYPGHQAPDWDAPAEVRLALEAMGGMYPLRLSTTPLDDEQRFGEHYTAIVERSLRNLDIPAAWSAYSALPEWTDTPEVSINKGAITSIQKIDTGRMENLENVQS